VIRTLKISGFKRFKEESLPLGQLTVLTGANGTGKTSLVHSLLLIRRAARQPKPETVALNDEEGLQLGEGADVLNWQAKESELRFECEMESGENPCWRFGVPDERSLHLPLVESPPMAPQSFADGGRRFAYVGAERLGPRDALSASSASIADLDVGYCGQHVAQVLAVLDRKVIPPGRHTDSGGETTLADLAHQTEYWTCRIVRPLEIRAEWFPNSMVTRLRFKTPGIRSDWTRPPNMGFGVSYALPVIVAGLVAAVGGLLVVENPEAHLHPAGQSEMGRFLGQVAADGVQVVVETHSDHVLNGIRHAVANPRHPLQSKDTKINYFLAEAEEHARGVFLTLDISSSGAVSGWPVGFFDQSDRDLRALAELQLKSRRA